MCTHCRTVFNPYSRKMLLVKCGKCPSCLQEKAFARATRIKNNYDDGMLCLFFTLTYSNDYLPIIDKRDLFLDSSSDVNVVRSCTIRQVYNRHKDVVYWKKFNDPDIIGSVSKFDLDLSDIDKVPHPNGISDPVFGVCWYPDIQDFYKRLRNFLKRKNNYEKSFSYYSCSEIGGCTKRPHFHGLLFIPREDEKLFRTAIVESWPFADKTRTAKFIEIARDAANYVASYVTCNSRLLSVFQNDFFKPKHSHSKNFGCVLDCFSLRSILSKIDSGDLFYYRRTRFNGQTDVFPVPIPLYILYRYFPVCKGFSWLDCRQLRAILLNPESAGDILTDIDVIFNYRRLIYDYDNFTHLYLPALFVNNKIRVHRQCKLVNPLYHYTPKETYQIYVRLENCYQRFHSETGLSRFDYAFYYERVYSLYHSMILKCLHENVELIDDYADFYDNAFEVVANPSLSPTLSNLNLTADPNRRKFIVAQTDRNNSLFYRMDKQRKVTNFAMSNIGYYV